MSRYLLVALLAAACLTAPTWAAPPTRPNGPPPEVITGRIGPDGNLNITRTVIVYRTVEQERKVIVAGKETLVREAVVVPAEEKVAMQIVARDLKAFDLDGLPIDAGKLPKLLEKETSILVTPDGQPPDGFYRQFFKEGTLLMALPGFASNPGVVGAPTPVAAPGVAP